MALLAMSYCGNGSMAADSSAAELRSPNGKLAMTFWLGDEGVPCYRLAFNGKPVVCDSKLGLEFRNKPAMADGFVLDRADKTSKDATWEPVWGEVKHIRNHYNELAVSLRQPRFDDRKLVIRFRLFDDGLGFRYEVPEQKDVNYLTVTGEKTQFVMAGDHKTFWIPGDYDTNEYIYTISKLSEVSAPSKGKAGEEIALRTLIAPNVIQTPLMMKTADGLYINIHEAALVRYSCMDIAVDRQSLTLSVHLVPDAFGNKAYWQAPSQTPWRTIVVSDKAADILASKLILNLNEPSKLADTSWIHPQKYVGVWWEMHVGKSSWSYSEDGKVSLLGTDWAGRKPNGMHGATTENVKRYIDFAAKHGFNGVLVEGWNVGWEDWFGNWKEDVFDFVTPYPDFDLLGLQKYAADKGVKIIMHHETSSSVTNYERRMEEALRFAKAHGYDSVKTGYVGRIIPRGERHDGQWMVDHYVRVAEATARHKMMLDSHEAVRPTGLQRTYPNWLACESARGNEYNAWSMGNPPEHETILPFTRLMGGPMDYTPGIFQIKLDYYQPGKTEQVHTTLAKQLALYVTLYSPLQMAADLPENYEKHLDAFKFIEDVAVDWDDTRIIDAEPGDYLSIARKAKGKDEWYIGAITDENARRMTVPLDFLTPGQSYVAAIYADADDAHWQTNPMAYRIDHAIVTDKSVLTLNLACGGGAAVSVRPASAADVKDLKPYAPHKP